MNPALIAVLFLNQTVNAGRFPVAAIDEPDRYDSSYGRPSYETVKRVSPLTNVALAVLTVFLIFMMFVLYEVIVVGNKSWPA